MSFSPIFPEPPVADLSRIPPGYVYVGHGPLPRALHRTGELYNNRTYLAGWCLTSREWTIGPRWSGVDPKTPYAVEKGLLARLYPDLLDWAPIPVTPHEF